MIISPPASARHGILHRAWDARMHEHKLARIKACKYTCHGSTHACLHARWMHGPCKHMRKRKDKVCQADTNIDTDTDIDTHTRHMCARARTRRLDRQAWKAMTGPTPQAIGSWTLRHSGIKAAHATTRQGLSQTNQCMHFRSRWSMRSYHWCYHGVGESRISSEQAWLVVNRACVHG